jgi:hypothetical protein
MVLSSGCVEEEERGGPVHRADDDAGWAMAEEIQRQRPDSLVLWGCYSKHYVAFPLFPVRRRAVLAAFYPDALVARMEEAERVLRVEPDGGR